MIRLIPLLYMSQIWNRGKPACKESAQQLDSDKTHIHVVCSLVTFNVNMCFPKCQTTPLRLKMGFLDKLCGVYSIWSCCCTCWTQAKLSLFLLILLLLTYCIFCWRFRDTVSNQQGVYIYYEASMSFTFCFLPSLYWLHLCWAAAALFSLSTTSFRGREAIH